MLQIFVSFTKGREETSMFLASFSSDTKEWFASIVARQILPVTLRQLMNMANNNQ